MYDAILNKQQQINDFTHTDELKIT